MIKLSKKLLVCGALLALAGCVDSNSVVESSVNEPTVNEPTIDEPIVDEPTVDEPTVDEPTVDEPTVDEPTVDEPSDGVDTAPQVSLAVGQQFFETLCSECHGASGDGIFLLDPTACLVADCSSIDTVASFINDFMPRGNAQACTLGDDDSCAITTAAYILNNFSAEDDTDPTGENVVVMGTVGVKTPLSRLTNYEFVNSVRSLLNLENDSPNIVAAESSLSAEFVVNGLKNDAATQALSQLAISGYLSMASAGVDDLMTDVATRGQLGVALGCWDLIDGFKKNSQMGACLELYSKQLLSKAYRRPITEEEAAHIVVVYKEALDISASYGLGDVGRFGESLRSIAQYIFLSPEFLLLVESGDAVGGNSSVTSTPLSNHEIATRMALFLSGGLPDDELLAAADAGLLMDADVRLHHTNRLMNSPTGIAQFVTIITDWLEIDDDEVTDADSLVAIEEFIANWFFYEGRFSYLYQGPVTVEHTDGAKTSEPFGVLGLKAFLESHTTEPTPSFITRGVFVVEGLLCQALPEDLPDEALDSGALTPIEVFEVHTKQDCATCHVVFDNYGAAFQNFSAETMLFDSSSQDFGTSFDLYDIGDITSSVSNVGDLGSTMGASERAASCMGELWYRNALRRNIDADGQDDDTMNSIVQAWSETSDNSMKSLLRSIVLSDSFVTLFH